MPLENPSGYLHRTLSCRLTEDKKLRLPKLAEFHAESNLVAPTSNFQKRWAVRIGITFTADAELVTFHASASPLRVRFIIFRDSLQDFRESCDPES